MKVRIAIVEDNATARTALRGHLMSVNNVAISSFATGSELKAVLKTQQFDMLLVDYHLGTGKNGVEWLQRLRETGYIRPSTSIVFLTSDRAPQTIGKIIDLQPDILLIKPYTIASLTRQITHHLTYRDFIQDVLVTLDNKQLNRAIDLLRTHIENRIPPRLVADVRKLYARLLFDNGEIQRAHSIYDDILMRSDKVLWAQWGKIKCQYASGQWADCKGQLYDLLNSSLARDRAFEWLASISFEQKNYKGVEDHLSQIKFSELSLPAVKLKSLAFQKQDKVIEAIDLLQKKRAMHRSAKEHFNDFTFGLAEFYLLLAEASPETNRSESLSQARKLVGIAARGQADQQALQKRDYLLAFAAVLDDDLDKAAHLLALGYMNNFLQTEPSLLVIAARVHHGLGDKNKASELLLLAKEKNSSLHTISLQVMNDELIFAGGERLDLNHEQALVANESGTKSFVDNSYQEALKYFYNAFHLSPTTVAFGLNLLQCMIDSDTQVYRGYDVNQLLAKLSRIALNETNKTRLAQLTLSLQERNSP